MDSLRVFGVRSVVGAFLILCGAVFNSHAQSTGASSAQEAPPSPPAVPAAPADETADDIDAEQVYIDFLDAIGGRARVEAIDSAYSRTRLETRNQSMIVQTHWRSDGAFRVEYQAMGVTNQGGSDGAVSWMYQSNKGYSLIPANAVAVTYERANRPTMLLSLRDDYEKMRYIGRDSFLDRPVYRIELTHESGKLHFIFFDRETKLPLGIRWSEEGPMGEYMTELLFEEWKEYGEIRSWSRLVMKRLGTEQSLNIEQLEFNSVPPETFELPEEVKKLVAQQAANPPAPQEAPKTLPNPASNPETAPKPPAKP